jgi:uncharacterized protein YfaS (alpha-2-macroglobulin family)
MRKFLILPLLFFFIACSTSDKEAPVFEKKFSPYIASYTSGLIAKKSSINIYFNKDITDYNVGEKLSLNIIEFSPKLEGDLVLRDKRHLEFSPNEVLKSDQIYTSELALSELFDVPDSLAKFSFGFKTIKQRLAFKGHNLEASPAGQMQYYRLELNLESADYCELAELESLFQVLKDGQKLNGAWSQGAHANYTFTVDSLIRKEEASILSLKLNENHPLNQDLVNRDIEIPSLNDFKYLSYSLEGENSSQLKLNFSDPLREDQDLQGIISIEGQGDLKLEIGNSSIRVFLPENLAGEQVLKIAPGIENILAYKSTFSQELRFKITNEKPQIVFLENGNIMPVNDNLNLSFKAINLTSVDLRLIKIHENNIINFLQVNDYNGEYQLYRVGEKVLETKIDLGKKTAVDWQHFAIDLSEYFEPEEGAVYRVMLSFKKEYSLYNCPSDAETEREYEDDDYYYDDYYEEDYYYRNNGSDVYNTSDYSFRYPPGYNWRERENPCHVSYYNSNRFLSRNIWVSNLGLIAKKGQNDIWDFTVSDLVSTEAVSSARVELFNFQGRLLSSGQTDAEGFLNLTCQEPAFIAVASYEKSKTYLKLMLGEALAMNNFDVGGESIQNGLKGFLYTERGVRRPGDSIHLGFILQDKEKSLPLGHPIEFTLIDPQNRLVDRQVSNIEGQNLFTFQSKTRPSAVTGKYTATIRVGDRSFSKSILVETIKPNRLKIDLSFTNKPQFLDEGNLGVESQISWLTGIAAKESKLTLDAKFNSISAPFPQYRGFIFSDRIRKFHSENKRIYEGDMDADGKGSLQLELGDFKNAPSLISIQVEAKAFEGGGDYSTEFFQQSISPFPVLLGVKTPKANNGSFLETDRDYELEIKTVNPDGQPIALSNMEVKIYRVDWHWWYSSRGENLGRYVDNEATYLYSSAEVSSFNGVAKHSFKIDYPNWGRFLVRVCDPKGGHCTSTFMWFNWPEGKKGERPELASSNILNFNADKEEYKIGEKVEIEFPASPGARILVSIENSHKVIRKLWLSSEADKKNFSFIVDEEMAPNIYVQASLIQAHAQKSNDRPMRLYGIAALTIKNPQRELKPLIKHSDDWRPESEEWVEISEENGQDMEYTLAIVDEGLLNLTGYKCPKPYPYFYGKEAHGVSTWDMYEDVMGAYSGALQKVMGIGGDEALKNAENSNQNRFKPMVRFMGPFKLKAGEKKKHMLKLPNYIGSVKVMVVAANSKLSYGNAATSIKVTKPLMVLNTLPRILSPEDEISMPVTVFVSDPKIKTVKVDLKKTGPVEIIGSSSKSIKFSKPGQEIVYFKFKVLSKRGVVKLKAEVSAAGERSYDETELKVRIPNLPEMRTDQFVIAPNSDTTVEYQPYGIEGTNFLSIEASSIPTLNIEKHLHYLSSYPYGCSEQITSSVFAGLFLPKILELSEAQLKNRKQNTNIALERLYERQMPNGEIRYWPNSRSHSYNSYVTSYVGHFLIEAKKAGFELPPTMFKRWLSYQKSRARSWVPKYSTGNSYIYNDMDQAYRLLTLSLTNEPEIGAMNRLKELAISTPALYQLAAAYAIIGQKQTADIIFTRAENLEYESTDYRYFGNPLRNESIKLLTMHLLNNKSAAMLHGRKVAKLMNGEGYYTTHSLSFAMLSLLNVYGDDLKSDTDLDWAIQKANLKKSFHSDYSFLRYTVDKDLDKAEQMKIINNGAKILFISLNQQGSSLSTSKAAYNRGVQMDIVFRSISGDQINPEEIKQGTDFEMEVTIVKTGSKNAYQDMALKQFIPAGWQVLSSSNDILAGREAYDYRDIRDDRIYTFFSLRNSKKQTFKLRLNATYAGRYYLPAFETEDMYHPEITARSAARWVVVKP